MKKFSSSVILKENGEWFWLKKRTIKIISYTIYVIAMIMLAAIVVPIVRSYDKPAEFVNYIHSYGIWGNLMMMFIQIAQIIVALIPGELVEFVAGTLYGWFGGWVFCTVGIFLGQLIIFKSVRFLGKDFVEKVAGSKTVNKFKFLQDEKKLKTIIFFLFFIPGTPKDLITYIVPLTKIKLRDFLAISIIARIPSVISSTYAGYAYAESNYLLMAIMYGGILIFSIVGVLIYRRFEAKKMNKNNDN